MTERLTPARHSHLTHAAHETPAELSHAGREVMDPIEHQASPTDHTGHDMNHNGHANLDVNPKDHTSHGMDNTGHADHGIDHKGHAGHGVDHTGHEILFRNRFWICLLLSIPVLLYSPTIQRWLDFSMPEFAGSQWITPVFATIVFFVGGVPFIRMAVPEIRNRKPGMMTLITLAISVAYLYSLAALAFAPDTGFFWELVLLIDVMLLGHWLEMRSVRQASGALNELAKLLPDEAERIDADGNAETVAIAQLRSGDLVLVRPGASIPADGHVIEGSSDVNEALITGESKPVGKRPGDPVIAGTINGDGSLRVRITATGDETALAGIMRLVEEAQQSKSETQVLADKAAGWLFYIAVAFALITAIFWTVGQGFGVEVITRVATVLVIACPHALGLAIPLVVAISTSKAANNGILVRDRLALEEARNVNMVIFDKTGTLTEGEFGVVNIATVDSLPSSVRANGWSPEAALALTAAIEGDSEHTIAQGIRRSAEERSLDLPEVAEFEAIKGRGVRARANGHEVHVGGPRLLEMLGAELPSALVQFRDEASAKGQTVVYLIQDGRAVAALALADVIRPESRQAVARLHKMGIEVAMLTGDSIDVAAAVAQELDIDTYFAQVLPEHKSEKVAELQGQGKKVAMVGDGVNDAPALTRADIGVAIGSGTDVAVESADIILVQSNPMDVVKMIELSRATRKKMVENLWWAAGYNIVFIPLAAFTLFITPAIGALFMSMSTVIVALNAQTLRRVELG